MTTDTKAVARYNNHWAPFDSFMAQAEDGSYLLFTDHERVVGELEKSKAIDENHIHVLRTVLAASRAEAEGFKKDAERYRWMRDHAGKDDDLVEIFIDQESYAPGHLDAQVDAAMEKGNV